MWIEVRKWSYAWCFLWCWCCDHCCSGCASTDNAAESSVQIAYLSVNDRVELDIKYADELGRSIASLPILCTCFVFRPHWSVIFKEAASLYVSNTLILNAHALFLSLFIRLYLPWSSWSSPCKNRDKLSWCCLHSHAKRFKWYTWHTWTFCSSGMSWHTSVSSQFRNTV